MYINGKEVSSTGIKLYDKQTRGEIAMPLVDRHIKEPASHIHKCRLLFTNNKDGYVLGEEVSILLWTWPSKCHAASI